MIEVKGLTKKYGKHLAVDNLSFEIEDGKITGFLGPNGAGKSTTMNMMTGYLAPGKGTVLINGTDILKEPEKAKKQIGYLPELPPVYPDMTVREYLSFVTELKKVPKKERASQIEKIEEMCEINDVDGRLIKNLSKGYRQRVGLAQALVGFPPVIILDEPMVGLDPKQIIEIRDLIKKLGESHTVILSSHILSEISMVCDRIMIISKGKLVAYDTPENLTKEASHGNGIRLTARGDKEAVSSVLSGIEGVEYVFTAEESGKVSATVKSEASEELAEKVFFAFADARIPLMMMQPVSDSLEDIFLELTDPGKPETAETAETEGTAENTETADTAEPAGTAENAVNAESAKNTDNTDSENTEEE